jgi:hypothetical protein
VPRPLATRFLTLLPASDGDVSPNDGAIFYDRARPEPFKSQFYVHYTNHQFYNRVAARIRVVHRVVATAGAVVAGRVVVVTGVGATSTLHPPSGLAW